MNRPEFVTNLIKPYLLGKKSFSYNDKENACYYNGPNGENCAFASACTKEGRKKLSSLEGKRASVVLEILYDNILSPEAKAQDFKNFVWNHIQVLHDSLAKKDYRGFCISLTHIQQIVNDPLEELETLARNYFNLN